MSSSDLSSELPNELPIPGPLVPRINGFLSLPRIVFGGGALSHQYNSEELLSGDTPLRTVQLALRYGITAFDTSAYYGPSEILLGNALKALKNEFPRSSYQLMTKCGRYGMRDFDYMPTRIRESVIQSLQRLQTDYLDVVHLHDLEFVCTEVTPRQTGNHTSALGEEKAAYGLREGEEGQIRGEGDQKILDAFAELRKMQEEGLIRHIGITGYPLYTLLRISLLILHNPPFKPVDAILSYSNLNLQNDTLLEFAPQLLERAQVRQLLAASPFSMGLLTDAGPPSWHPASPTLRSATAKAAQECKARGRSLADLATGYCIRHTGGAVPLVVGFSRPNEVHECVRVWREIEGSTDNSERLEQEEGVKSVFREADNENRNTHLSASRQPHMDPSTTIFLLCDLQEKFRSVIYGFEHVVASTNKTLRVAKLLGCEVLVTTQKARALGPTDPSVNLDSLGALHVGTFDKTLFSMLTPEVRAFLDSRPGIKSVVLMGIETALSLVDHPKYTTYVLADAVSSTNPAEISLAFARMRAAGVIVTTSESLAFQLIRDASIPEFKAFSNIIKEEKEATSKAVEALLLGRSAL
ncbi:Aldo/keto reductase family-domain-containing protein [Favolaschia claudopus]|uniref:Aldo/keto reductase family-domain-containing protein n=1 Tax=Favolaschia claudopus TaxID=2862362 RepID=A0AAW0E849_9AGAR